MDASNRAKGHEFHKETLESIAFPGTKVTEWVMNTPVRWVAAIQETTSGFECVLKEVDFQKLHNRNYAALLGIKRAKPEVQDDENVYRAQQRAKKLVRLKCKQIQADHLLTLTTREDSNTAEQMYARFTKFVRNYRAVVGDQWEYVAVLEAHPSNTAHLHLHVACVGMVDVNVARNIWCAILGGKGQGNIDAKHIKVAGGDRTEKAVRIAKYISKYVTKDSAVAFNKRRYWASKIDLPKLRRMLLDATTFEGAFLEFAERMDFNEALMRQSAHVWCFPGGKGFWMEFVPELMNDPPF